MACAKFQLEAYAEAIAWLRRSNEVNRNYPIAYFHLAAAQAQVGELGEARAAMKAGLALHPEFTVGHYRLNPRSDNPIYLAGHERVYEGMRMAGVPEG